MFPWATLAFPQKLMLFRDTLYGLEKFHAAGYMHRDISEKNLLIVATSPVPTAAICDFGKATNKKTSSNSYIAPPYALAPEVPGNKNGAAPAGGGQGIDSSGRYDRRIDIWSLAYMWYRCLDPGTPMKRVDQAQHSKMMQFLRALAAEKGPEEHLASLMQQMLAWNPLKRPSAEDALNSKVMSCLKDTRKMEKSGEKRARVDTSNAKNDRVEAGIELE